MTSLFDRFRGRKEPSSAEIAKERLKLVLVSDRSDLSPEKLEQMQDEIIEVIKRYIQVDTTKVHISVEQRARENYLVADIPLVRDHSYGAGLEAPVPPLAASASGPVMAAQRTAKVDQAVASAPGVEQAEPPVSDTDTQPTKPAGSATPADQPDSPTP